MVDLEEQKSKSQVKREMLALQSLGEELVELSANQLREIEMPQDLREAVLFAGTIKKRGALRRQMQYIGTLMRNVAPESIRTAMTDIRRGRGQDLLLLKQLERWRDGLIDGKEECVGEIAKHFPDADRKRLLRLALNARKEREGNESSRAARVLFRYLRELSGR